MPSKPILLGSYQHFCWCKHHFWCSNAKQNHPGCRSITVKLSEYLSIHPTNQIYLSIYLSMGKSPKNESTFCACRWLSASASSRISPQWQLGDGTAPFRPFTIKSFRKLHIYHSYIYLFIYMYIYIYIYMYIYFYVYNYFLSIYVFIDLLFFFIYVCIYFYMYITPIHIYIYIHYIYIYISSIYIYIHLINIYIYI